MNYSKNLINSIRNIHTVRCELNGTCNTNKNSNKTNAKHETYIAETLINNGFLEKSKKNYMLSEKEFKILYKKNPLNISLLKPGEFIQQPFGSQKSPDFLIQIKENILISLEAKSSKTKTPKYNSGGIKLDYIYLFYNSVLNETTYYLGKDIITIKQSSIINNYQKESFELANKYNKLLKTNDTLNRGWSIYPRIMINQKGTSTYTDYFNHNDRNKCEDNVIKYLETFI
jgi:hypothetical protein